MSQSSVLFCFFCYITSVILLRTLVQYFQFVYQIYFPLRDKFEELTAVGFSCDVRLTIDYLLALGMSSHTVLLQYLISVNSLQSVLD